MFNKYDVFWGDKEVLKHSFIFVYLSQSYRDIVHRLIYFPGGLSDQHWPRLKPGAWGFIHVTHV